MDVVQFALVSWLFLCVRGIHSRNTDEAERPNQNDDAGPSNRTGDGGQGMRPVRHTGRWRKGKLSPPAWDQRACCGDGGLCVLGSFCLCYRYYYGRHCEFYSEGRSCGTIKDGEIVDIRCRLCVCEDGYLTCYTKTKECLDRNGEGNSKVMQLNFNNGEVKTPSFLSNRNSASVHKSRLSVYWITLLLIFVT